MTTVSNVARLLALSMTFRGIAVVSAQARDYQVVILNDQVIDPETKLDATTDTRSEATLRYFQNEVKPTR